MASETSRLSTSDIVAFGCAVGDHRLYFRHTEAQGGTVWDSAVHGAVLRLVGTARWQKVLTG